jgi:hypothetical protein
MVPRAREALAKSVPYPATVLGLSLVLAGSLHRGMPLRLHVLAQLHDRLPAGRAVMVHSHSGHFQVTTLPFSDSFTIVFGSS